MAYFIDALTLADATAVYLDQYLTTPARDGYYSNGVISRQQVSGLLLPAESCDGVICPVTCPVVDLDVDESGRTDVVVNVGSSVGVMIIKFQPYSFPDGIRVKYNGVTYNKLYSTNELFPFNSTDSNNFTVIVNPANDCGLIGNTTYKNGIGVYQWTGTEFIGIGSENVVIYPGDVISTGGGDPGLLQMVIPKTVSNPKIVVETVGACSDNVYQLSVSCTTTLPAISSSTTQATSVDACSSAKTTTIYQVKNLFDGQDNLIKLYDILFADQYGVSVASEGWYNVSGNTYPGQSVVHVNEHGIVDQTLSCP